jgi:hypothetical protein
MKACRIGHIAIVVLLASSGLYLFLLGANFYYRKTAEHLLNDIHVLGSSSMTCVAANGLLAGRYLAQPVPGATMYSVNNYWLTRLLVKLRITQPTGYAGLRPWLVRASVTCQDQRIDGNWFTVIIGATGAGDLSISSWARPSSPYAYCVHYSLKRHPGYVVTHASNLRRLNIRIGEEATPTEREEGSHVNLSCLTRFRPCRELPDLMPEAWKDYQSDAEWEKAHRDQISEDLNSDPNCSSRQ